MRARRASAPAPLHMQKAKLPASSSSRPEPPRLLLLLSGAASPPTPPVRRCPASYSTRLEPPRLLLLSSGTAPHLPRVPLTCSAAQRRPQPLLAAAMASAPPCAPPHPSRRLGPIRRAPNPHTRADELPPPHQCIWIRPGCPAIAGLDGHGHGPALLRRRHSAALSLPQ